MIIKPPFRKVEVVGRRIRPSLPTLVLPPTRHSGGRAYVEVVGRDGRIVKDRPNANKWQKNLLLDQGLNVHCGGTPSTTPRTWENCFSVAVAGTGGTNPTKIPSGVITASQTGDIVTTSAPFVDDGGLGIGDVGKIIRWDGTGHEARIIDYLTSTTFQVDNEFEQDAEIFDLYAVNQTGMQTELKRSNTYVTGACSTVLDVGNGKTVNTRVYDFSTESSNQNYAEIGFSYTTSAGNNLTVRIVLDGTVTVLAGEKLRITYRWTVTMSPITEQTGDLDITGWPIAPSVSLGAKWMPQLWGLSAITANGVATSVDVSGNCNEVGQATAKLYNKNGSSLHTFSSFGSNNITNLLDLTALVGTTRLATLNTYVANSFYRDSAFFWDNLDFASTSIICLGLQPSTNTNQNSLGYKFLFDEPQTKDFDHTLTLTVRQSCSRDLSQSA
jgi:hypothetical protein